MLAGPRKTCDGWGWSREVPSGPFLRRVQIEGEHMVKFDSNGLVPAIVQDAATGEVLMLAYMNAESVQRTLASGEAWFWSRSRSELWHKGATSGSIMRVKEVLVDCDEDTILVRADPQGPACHTGNRTCFYREIRSTE